MDRSRRDALKAALAAAVAGVAPASLLRAAASAGVVRLPLADGSALEFGPRQVVHVKPGPKPNEIAARVPVRNGNFRLKGGGEVILENGIPKMNEMGNSMLFIEFKEHSVFVEWKSQGPPTEEFKARQAAAPKAKSWVVKNKLTGENLEYRAQ